MVPYTGIRSEASNLRFNAWIEMNETDPAKAVEATRAKLREQIRSQSESDNEAARNIQALRVDDREPVEVKLIPQSWGYPERVMVVW